jgi:hypothetical protein
MGALLDTANAAKSALARRVGAQTVAGRVRLLAGASAVALLLAASAPAWAQSVGGTGGNSAGGAVGGQGSNVVGGGGVSTTNGAGAGGGGSGGLGGAATGGGGNGGAGGSNENFGVGVIFGGAGVAGGTVTTATDGGGGSGGGAGGVGFLLSGAANQTSGFNISGGQGGAGETVTGAGNGGSGGQGGAGAVLSNAALLWDNSSVTGGGGGPGGASTGGGALGAAGNGGAGVVLSGGSEFQIGGAATTSFLSGGVAAEGGVAGNAIESVAGVNTVQFGGDISVNGAFAVSNGATLNIDQANFNGNPTGFGNITLANTITGAGAVSITAGTNTVTLSGVNSYSGGTTVTTGTLAITNASALGSDGVTLAAGAAPGAGGNLVVGSGVAFTSNLNMLANSSVTLGGNASIGAVTVTGDPTFNVTGANSTGAISGAGAVVVLGAGGGAATDVLTLNGASNYAGATTVGDGTAGGAVTLKAGGAGVFSPGSATTVTADSILDINGGDQTVSSLSGGGAAKNSGAVALLANQGASSQFDGTIAGANIGLIQNSPNNTLTLTGNNDYSGPTQIVAGALALKNAGSISGSSDVQIATGGTFDISTTNAGATIDTLSDLAGGQGSVYLGAKTLTLANASTTFSGVISGSGGVTLNLGALTLAGDNTYTGVTTVNGGTLINNKTIAGAVTNAATTDNVGLIGGLDTNNAGTFSNTGEIDGGVVNKATFNAAGAIKGAIDNQNGGVFTVTGALASDNFSAFTNETGATLDVEAGAFTKLATLDNNGGAVTVEDTLSAGAINQNLGSFTNTGTVTTTAGTSVNGGVFTNSGAINGGATVTGGELTTTGAINGGLTNSANVLAQGAIGGGVSNSGSFVVTGALNNGGGDFINAGGGMVSFAAANLTYSNIGAFTNNDTVTLGQYPSNTGDTLTTQTFVNNATVTGVGVINGAMTNNGSIYVGALNAPASGYNLTIGGAYSGAGIAYTAADLNTAKANTITVDGAVAGSPLNIAISGQSGAAYFGKLTVANLNGGGAFVDTAQTEAALAQASHGFYLYSFGATPGGQGVIQIPNSALASAPLAQVASTITALNTSFFQNSSAFLGQASNPEPNHWSFGVWNRDAVADTDIASQSALANSGSAAQASHVDTRLAGFQYGLDAGLFNIQNSGFNTHMGVTVGDVFTSSADHANPGATSTAEIPFVGAYGALTGKCFAAIVGVRYDNYNLTLNNAIENVHNQSLDGHAVTVSADVQYDVPIGTAVFVEPSAGVYVSRTNIESQVFDAGTASFGSIDSTLSRIGIRAGVATQAGGVVLQPFVAANVYHEWAGDAQTLFTPVTAGAPTLTIDTTRVGTFEQASVGVGWQVPGSGWTGYLRSDAKFGPQVEGWTLTAGLRYAW